MSILRIIFFLPSILILSPLVIYNLHDNIILDTVGMDKAQRLAYLNDSENLKKYFDLALSLFKKLRPSAIAISALFYFMLYKYLTL